MRGRIHRLWPIAAGVLLAQVALLAGCGGSGSRSEPTVTTTTTAPATTTLPATTTPSPLALRVYFLRDGKVVPVLRRVPQTRAVAAAAQAALAAGPRQGENLETAVPVDYAPSIAVDGGVARLTGGPTLSAEGRAQVVATLTQFPTVREVDLDGKRLTRKSVEDETPLILVESPLPGEMVTSPIRVTGTANTFEANVEWELQAGGKVVEKGFTTASSGSGERGTFDFEVPYNARGPATLVLYQTSAADGSRQDVFPVPLVLG
jgi:hypothetical protein